MLLLPSRQEKFLEIGKKIPRHHCDPDQLTEPGELRVTECGQVAVGISGPVRDADRAE
jgi:hypothetical protein